MDIVKAKSVKRNYYLGLIISALVYVILTFTAPILSNSYNLSNTSTRLLQLAFVLPVLLIWILAVYGAANFKYYSSLIQDSADGKALDKVSNGLVVLVAGSIVQSLFATLRTRMITSGHAIGFTYLNIALTIVLPIAAFYMIYLGASGLVRLARQEGITPQSYLFPIVAFTALSSTYTWAVLNNPYRNATPDIIKYTSYFMPDILIILLVVTPIVATWLFGILAVTSIKNYQHSAKGSLYRQALAKLANGLLAVVVFSILIQFLGALGPSLNLSSASLKFIIILIYVILILYAVGYGFIASGAKRLAKIEEVK
ncbi:MAG TPA: hypothetical protein VLF41_02360 [Candidatus Nanoarchaeia archaeon]|nr:hypothetical protein [Candidatus Nanoarchaeia archaeon]